MIREDPNVLGGGTTMDSNILIKDAKRYPYHKKISQIILTLQNLAQEIQVNDVLDYMEVNFKHTIISMKQVCFG